MRIPARARRSSREDLRGLGSSGAVELRAAERSAESASVGGDRHPIADAARRIAVDAYGDRLDPAVVELRGSRRDVRAFLDVPVPMSRRVLSGPPGEELHSVAGDGQQRLETLADPC